MLIKDKNKKTRTLKVIEAFLKEEGVDFQTELVTTDDFGYQMVWRIYFPELDLVIRPAIVGEYKEDYFKRHTKFCRNDLQLNMIIINTSVQNLIKPYIAKLIQKSTETQGCLWNISGPKSLLAVLKFLEIPLIRPL